MENTKHLRNWIDRQVEAEFKGNLAAFAQKTKVSRQTWMNILSRKYNSLSQQAVNDLCSLFNLHEIDLYLIAHPHIAPSKPLEKPSPSDNIRDDAGRLADYLRSAREEDQEFIFSAAERCGFKRRSNRHE